MRVTIVSFVRGRSDYADAEAEFSRRLAAHTRVEQETIKSWRDETTLPARLDRAHVIGLCIDGKAFDSEGLAQHLGKLQQQGRSHLVFVIGAADGMPLAVDQQLQERWSLSPLTFSHRLARLLLLEVLYRSFDLLHGGGRYHK